VPDRGRLDWLFERILGRFESRHLLLGAFALLLISTVGYTAWQLVTGAQRVVDELLAEVASHVQRETRREIDRFIALPDAINRHTVDAITDGSVPLSDFQALHRLFWTAPQQAERPVTSIYVGTHGGSFAGMHTVGKAWPAEEWVYSVTSQNNGGRVIIFETDRAGMIDSMPRLSMIYDPRERGWFRNAASSPAGEPVWGDVYESFVSGLLTITRAEAIRDSAGTLLGVAGVDLHLEHFQQFVDSVSLGANGEMFMVDAEGTLIASHVGPSGNGESGRPDSIEAAGRFTRAASEYIESTLGGVGELTSNLDERVELDGEAGYLSLHTVREEQGLDWRIGVFVPESDYLGSLPLQLQRIVPLVLIALAIALLTFAGFAALVLRPLRELGEGTARIAGGRFDTPIDTGCDNEVGALARSIDDMRVRLRRSFDELIEQKMRAETTLESIADGVVMLAPDGTVRYMNPAAERLLGHTLEQAVGKEVVEVFQARDERSGMPFTRQQILHAMTDGREIGRPVVVTSSSGETHVVQCRVSPMRDEAGRTHGAVLNFSDMSKEVRLRSELMHQSTHDALTGLVNRREFERRVERAIDGATRSGDEHVLCCLDLDRFSLVNDTVGHEAADELLKRVARLLDESVRGGDTVGRTGVDEFGVLLEQCDLAQAVELCERLREGVENLDLTWKGRACGTTVSGGLLVVGPGSGDMVDVMRDVVGACSIAKGAGRNRLHTHRENDERLLQLRGEQSWIERIGHAIRNDGLVLHAQRIEATCRGGLPHHHVEVLVRMLDDSGELLAPGAFLPAAERYNLIAKLDRWVIARAFAWLASLEAVNGAPSVCSINLSGQSLGDETMLAFLVDELRRSGASPERLCFEITETAAIENLANALSLIEILRELGCTFALDDFGSGLSSFAYLKTLTVDYLKIDGMFVRDMLAQPLDLAMVRSINEVGQTMGMRTIAEYVENEEIREALGHLGVDYVQGFGVGRPEPLDTFRFPPLTPHERLAGIARDASDREAG